MAEVADGGEIASITVRLRGRDGNWVALEHAGAPIRGADGSLSYLLGTARDVSEREELRERVREVDALYRIADAIARTTSPEALFAEAVETLLEATRADRASVLILDDDGVMRFQAATVLSDRNRTFTGGHSPSAVDSLDRKPVLEVDIDGAGLDTEP